MANFNARTIIDFRNKLIGGGARANLFECEIPFPSGVLSDDANVISSDLKFLIKAAQLPASNVGSIPVAFRGRTLKLAGDRTYEPWTVTVLNDTNFRLRHAFEAWSNFMNRHNDNAGVITPSSYQKEILVHQLSRGTVSNDTTSPEIPGTNTSIPILRSYKLYGCFPTAVDPIPLSYDSSDTIEEFNVTFEVQYWTAIKYDNGNQTTLGE